MYAEERALIRSTTFLGSEEGGHEKEIITMAFVSHCS